MHFATALVFVLQNDLRRFNVSFNKFVVSVGSVHHDRSNASELVLENVLFSCYF